MESPCQHAAVGIDLGTTFSAVAFCDERGRPETIRNAEGDLTTPSAVFFDRSQPVVGVEAVEAGIEEPERLAMFAKRDVGEKWYDRQIRGERLPPEVLQAIILKKLKADAEMKLGPISKVVITVPAFFNEPCRKATQDAGRLAGLDVLDIINEPTAAAISYGVQHGFLSKTGESEQLERLLVYDLGGGTFDVTVMEISGGHFNTIATAGDVYLGGIDWDRRLVDLIAEAFVDEYSVDPRKDPHDEQELLRKACQAKHALTQRDSFLLSMNCQGHRLRKEISRSEFESVTEDLVERTLMTTRLVLDDAKISFGDLTRIVMVGGSTRMPMIRNEMERLSGLELDRSLSPDEAVCHGAAIYAGILLNHDGEAFAGVSVSNVNSHDLGVLALDPKTGDPRRKIMIARNSLLPAAKAIRFRTHQDDQPNVKIQIVEGGDDVGRGATAIGKCLVSPLPPSTPKGTHVDVRFKYSTDGRLAVSASLPEINCNAETVVDRSAGLSDVAIKDWIERMESGFADPENQEVADVASTDAAEPVSGPAGSSRGQCESTRFPGIVTDDGDRKKTAKRGKLKRVAAAPQKKSNRDAGGSDWKTRNRKNR